MKRVILFFGSLLVTGCASAPGSFTTNDFVWKQQKVNIGHEEVFERITNGGRRCTGLYHFRPVGYYLADNGSGHFDVFLPSLPGMESSFVGGRVEFANDGDGCVVDIGILKKYYNEKDSLGFYQQIAGYLAGKSGCWEPN